MSTKKEICQGDSMEITVLGYTVKGFVISEYIVTRGRDENNKDIIEGISFFLIDKKNDLVCFSRSDTFNTTRIVLTEKFKYPFRLNEEYQSRLNLAHAELKNRQYIHRSRQTGANYTFASSILLNIQKGVHGKNVTIITGNSK